jgi:hypothetical protein
VLAALSKTGLKILQIWNYLHLAAFVFPSVGFRLHKNQVNQLHVPPLGVLISSIPECYFQNRICRSANCRVDYYLLNQKDSHSSFADRIALSSCSLPARSLISCSKPCAGFRLLLDTASILDEQAVRPRKCCLKALSIRWGWQSGQVYERCIEWRTLSTSSIINFWWCRIS